MSDVMKSVSVIIPTYNESNEIASTLDALFKSNPLPHEVIVADGGSSDDTPQIIKSYNCRYINAPKGRASQMNMGASIADGDIIVFLHADTTLPFNFVELVNNILYKKNYVLGGFTSIMRGENTQWFISLNNY